MESGGDTEVEGGWGVDGAVVVLVVCLLNLVPLAYDLSVSAALHAGYDVTRYRWFRTVSRTMDGAGLAGEYGLVVVVVAFITTAIYLHVTAFFPFFADHHDDAAAIVVLHVLPSLWLNSGMLMCFYYAATRSPGTTADIDGLDVLPTDVLARIEARLGPLASLPPAQQRDALKVFGIRWCGECARAKPPHAHHCSTCGVCTLALDHHCPFLGVRDVGQENMRHFYPFLTHTVGATVYAMVLTWPSFHQCFWALPAAGSHSHAAGAMHAADPALDALCEALGSRNRLLFFVASGSFAVLGSLHAYMTYNLLHGKTMLENMPFFASRSAPPLRRADLREYYDHGTSSSFLRRASFYRDNLVRVFGPVTSWWRWFFPLGDLVYSLVRGIPPATDPGVVYGLPVDAAAVTGRSRAAVSRRSSADGAWS